MKVEHEDGVARLTLTRPEQLNAMTLDDYLALGDAVLEASAAPFIDIIVFGAPGEPSPRVAI